MLRAKWSSLVAGSAIALTLGVAACSDGVPTQPTDRPNATTVGGVVCEVVRTVTDDQGNVIEEILGIVGLDDPRTEQLENSICQLLRSGDITPEEANGLASKLSAALAALERGQINTFVNIMNAFINQVQGIYVNKLCSPGDVRPVCITLKKLVDDAQHLIASVLT